MHYDPSLLGQPSTLSEGMTRFPDTRELGVEVDDQNTFVRSILVSKKHYIGIQPDGKVVVKGMEGKKRDRLPFFNQVFLQLIEDYRNNKADLSLNVVEAFKQLEAAEVDPSLLTYSVVLNKDPDKYQSYTPQHKIGTFNFLGNF